VKIVKLKRKRRGAIGLGLKKRTNPVAEVARSILVKFGEQVAQTAVCLITPVPELVELDKIKIMHSIKSFIEAYEPSVKTNGLYKQQAKALEILSDKPLRNIIMTTATGSGKSLPFWAWIVEALARDPEATAIACFPTQALLWGQADRMRQISTQESLVTYDGQAYAGEILLGKFKIPWTVWFGITNSPEMEEHQKSSEFLRSRLRITTLDKVHWNLLRDRDSDFLSRLSAIVIDEAHIWHGLNGANVRGFMDRLRLSLDVAGVEHPSIFIASATINEPKEFAANLTGYAKSSFISFDDQGSVKVRLLPTKDITKEIESYSGPELRRYVLMLKPEPEPVTALQILGNENLIGSELNALCFVQSKFQGRLLRGDLEQKSKKRTAIVYDADMTSKERRLLEKRFFSGSERGKTVVATSALEVGVDLPFLDLVVMDDLPPRRTDLIQRIGRVGRRADRPGLAVLCLGYSFANERLIREPGKALSTEEIKPLLLPLGLESIRLKMMKASFEERRWRLKKREASWTDFNQALERYFGFSPTIQQLNELVKDKLGDLIDLDDGSWYYQGFRASASQGKRPLVLRKTGEWVAQIDDISIFRDAHPEGVYLGHRGQRYRIIGYKGNFILAKWTNPRSDIVLGKFIKDLKQIEVVEEKRKVVTRGRWRDSFIFEEIKDLPEGANPPRKGAFEYGVWSFIRKFDGYLEIDLSRKNKPRQVSLV